MRKWVEKGLVAIPFEVGQVSTSQTEQVKKGALQ